MKATLKRQKKITVIAGAAIILLILLGIAAHNITANEMRLIHSSISSTMATFENKYKRAESLMEISAEMDKESIESSLYLINLIFEKSADTQSALDVLHSDVSDCYLMDTKGNIQSAKGAAPLALSKEEQKQLKKDGSLTVKTDDNIAYYSIVNRPQGRLITCYRKSAELGTDSTLTGIAERFDYYIADDADGKVIECTDEQMMGTSVPENLKAPKIGSAENYRTKIKDARYGFAKIDIGKAYCLEYERDGYVYGLYYPLSYIILDVLNEMLTPLIVLAGSFVVILAFFFILWKDTSSEQKKWRSVFHSNYYFESSKVSHLFGFVLLALIVALLFSGHFFKFSSYSLQNQLSTENMDMLSENIKACEKDKQKLITIVNDYSAGLADNVTDLLVMDPKLGTHAQLKTLADHCYVSEISLYNTDGLQTASSGSYSGYKLTQNENDPLYAARSILTDDVETVFKDYDDGTGRYFLAQKRRDKPGIICFKYERPKLAQMVHYYSKEDAIRNTDFGDTSTFFIKAGEGEKTYVVEPYSTDIDTANFEMPEELRQDKYSGISKINGSDAYVNTKSSEGISIVSAIDCKDLDSSMTPIMVSVVLGFILLAVILFYGFVCEAESIEEIPAADSASEEKVNNKRNIKALFDDTCFRKMIKYELIVLVVAYILMMLKGTAGNQTVLEFIFNGKWEKGFNLFSINAGIIVAALSIAALYVLKALLMFFGRIIGPKGLSVCNIVVSVLQFCCLFFIIVHTLYQFGVDISTLLAGAGLAGLVIGIAAKDIFEDLIAGLFLIFEGNIRVGDFVDYNGFRGEITEIGARVSVIQRYNRKFIVNNSDIKQFYRLSDELGSAWVEIGVGPNEDLDKIRKLIDDSAEWYQERIPTIKEGPYFLNVTEFDSSGITIALCGMCTDERSGSTGRKIKYYTIELFREHGISLAKQSMKVEVAGIQAGDELEAYYESR